MMSQLVALLQKYNINDFSFADVGAKDNIEYIEEIKMITHLHAFEPNAKECAKLKNKYNSKHFKSLSINEIGLAQKTGDVTFYLSQHSAMSSILKPDIDNYDKHFGSYVEFNNWKKDITTTKEITITCKTLDDYSKNTIEEIDYLKIDTQGTELDILKGATELLSHQKIHIIKVEVSTVSIYKNQALFSDIDLYLRKHNYQMVDFITHKNENGSIFKNKNKNWQHAPCGDAIYVLNKIHTSQEYCIKNGIILHWLGYNSIASYYLKQTNLTQEELEVIYNIKINNAFSFRKQILKACLPPILYKLLF